MNLKQYESKYGKDETVFIPKNKKELEIIKANLEDAKKMINRGRCPIQLYKDKISVYEFLLKPLRVGTKVKIINCTYKKYIGKTGEIWEKRTGALGTGTEYNIYLGEVKIWLSRDDLEVLK